MQPINLDSAFARITEHWSPGVAAELNGQQVRLAKLLGEFVWHLHEHEDELFLIYRGRLRMGLRDVAGDPASEREVILGPGEMLVVPRGVEHRPVADEEVEVLLFEPSTTVNTGNARSDRTVERLPRLG